MISGMLKNPDCNVKALLLLAIDIVISFTADEFSGSGLGELTESAGLHMNSPDEEVRKLVYEIILTYNPELALRSIDIIMEDENPWNQLTVLDLIENIRKPEVNKLLEKFSFSADEMIRERALNLKNDRSINPIVNN
jgi:hypothetical protein